MPQSATFRIASIGLAALAIAMGVGRFAFTPLLPLMQDDGLISISEGGVLASVHFLGYWLGALLAGWLPWFPKRTLRTSLLLIALATLAMGLTGSFALWLAFRFLCGVLSAFALVLIANFYVRHLAETGRAGMQGWVFSGVGAGIAIAGLGTLALMAGGAGSAESWRIFGTVSLAAAAAISLLIGSEIPDAAPAASGRTAERTPLAWPLVIAYGALGLGYIIPATYLPVMARETVLSPLVFGWSWPVFGAAAFLSTLVAARLHARFTNRQVWAAGQLVMAAGLLLPAIHPHIVTVIVAGVCVGGTFMIATMAGIREAHRIAGAQDVQRHVAALTFAFATGQMIAPVLAGWAHDATASFSGPLLVTSIALAATALSLTRRPGNAELVRT